MSTELASATSAPARILSPAEAKQIAVMTPKATQAGFEKFLRHNISAMEAIAPTGFSAKRLMRAVLANVARTPNLQNCTIESIFRSSIQACELGLVVGSAVGEAYLVPYGSVCTLIPGYRGLVALAFRSGHVKSVRAKVVYQGDEFQYEDGLHMVLRHVPNFDAPRDPKYITHAYCVIDLKDGGVLTDVMTVTEVNAIRARSKASGSGPWVTDYAEMAKKTVCRRTLKYAPMSAEMSKALAADEAADTGDYAALAEFESYEDEPAAETASKVSRTRDKVGPVPDETTGEILQGDEDK